MKRTYDEWNKIQRSHIEREAAREKRTTITADGTAQFAATPQMVFRPEPAARARKPVRKRGDLPPEERPKRGGLTFRLTTNVKPDAPPVTIKAPAPTGEPIQFRGPVLPHHHAALMEIYKLSDEAIFITWAAVRFQIRKIAGAALGMPPNE